MRKLLNILELFGLLVVYILIRIMYTPAIWVGVPSFKNWCQYQEVINIDIRNLAIVTLHGIALIFVSWYWIVSFEGLLFAINWIVASIRIRKLNREGGN